MIKKSKAIIRMFSIALLFAFACILTAGCQDPLRAGINITKGPSEKFSGEEIDSAIDCVIERFNEEFQGNTLTDLWYDEERSDMLAKHHYGYSKKNVIALLSNIKSGGSDVCGGFDPNTTYPDFNWILVRNGEDGGWEIKTSGY